MDIINLLAIQEIKTKNMGFREKVLLFSLLEEWLFRAERQIQRFNGDKTRHKKATTSKIPRVWVYPQKMLFMDLHFYIIAMAHVSKILESLRRGGVEDVDFNVICKKNNAELQKLRNYFRGSLEHITENPLRGTNKKGEKLKNPGDFGNINGDVFTLFGEKFDIDRTFTLTKNLISDLRNWSNNKARRLYSPRV